MKKPYIKLLRKYDDIKVYLVDGEFVRNNLQISFTNFSHHFVFPEVIPLNEWWIDINSPPEEFPFFLNHLIREYYLMANGASYKKAFNAAVRKEKSVRIKAGLDVSPHILKKPIQNLKYKKLYKTINLENDDVVNVYIVNGEEVRDKSGDVGGFIDGSHGLVSHYIKEDEIFLEKNLSEQEKKFILVHELTEYMLMKYKDMSYIAAHNKANIEELKERQKELNSNEEG